MVRRYSGCARQAQSERLPDHWGSARTPLRAAGSIPAVIPCAAGLSPLNDARDKSGDSLWNMLFAARSDGPRACRPAFTARRDPRELKFAARSEWPRARRPAFTAGRAPREWPENRPFATIEKRNVFLRHYTSR